MGNEQSFIRVIPPVPIQGLLLRRLNTRKVVSSFRRLTAVRLERAAIRLLLFTGPPSTFAVHGFKSRRPASMQAGPLKALAHRPFLPLGRIAGCRKLLTPVTAEQ